MVMLTAGAIVGVEGKSDQSEAPCADDVTRQAIGCSPVDRTGDRIRVRNFLLMLPAVIRRYRGRNELYPQKRTLELSRVMSCFVPEADIRRDAGFPS